jgi:hypothetical protein
MSGKRKSRNTKEKKFLVFSVEFLVKKKGWGIV